MEIYDSLKDIKFLDEYWEQNAGKYQIYNLLKYIYGLQIKILKI